MRMQKDPLIAHGRAEIRLYFLVTPCSACGAGPLEPDAFAADTAVDRNVETCRAHCRSCGVDMVRSFRCPPEGGPGPDRPPPPEINTSVDPSEIIDVAQWLTLYALHVNAATVTNNAKEKRVSEIRARQCLSEALKFYGGDNDLPPASACFHETSRRRLQDHPESFSRQRLINLVAALPKPFDSHPTGSA